MKFGPVPPSKVPKQDPQKVLMLAERWQRATFAHERWARPAKEAVDFLEGRQYTEEQIRAAGKKKPLLKFNIIAPIVRLVIGYHRNNRTDITFSPAHDARATDEIATVLSSLEKAIATDNLLEFVDAAVFLDGLSAGRGYYRTMLDWESNDLGEIKTTAFDPFAVKLDPDGDTYDINESCSFLQTDKMVSIDEIEASFGKHAAGLIRPYTMGQTPLAPIAGHIIADEVSPVRFFGQREDTVNDWWDNFYSLMGDFVDTRRKTIRIIETEYKVRSPRNVIIDLETGDKKVLPEDWGLDKIEKALLYAELVGNPCVVERRLVEHMHWTTMAGDLMLYDAPSLYDRFTLTPYFPYFRRGVARGMVEDLIDPQKEKNKNRSNRVEIQSKLANGGWKYHESSLNPVQKANLKKFGSQPGVNVEWTGEHEPQQIQPQSPSTAYDRLEAKDDEDIRRISGVNESALGDTDIANQSGKAIEARQRQAVISVQMYMDNLRHTKHLVGRNHLGIVQAYYTEERIYRVTGDDGKKSPMIINQMIQDPFSSAKRILNDVTVGKYTVTVDEAPLNPTFAAAQWEEMMAIVEKIAPAMPQFVPTVIDLIIGMSSMPRKQEWLDRIQTMLAASGLVPAPAQPGALPAPAGAPAGAAPPQGLPAPGPQPALPPPVPA